VRLLLVAFLLSGCAAGRASLAQDLALATQALATCACEATGLASGRDVAGEPPRLWLAGDKAVYEVGADGALTERWTPPKFTRILRLEVGDLDGDGVDEWTVLTEANRLRTHLIVADGGERRSVGKPFLGSLRITPGPEGKPVLLGQRASGAGPFVGPVEHVTWAGEELALGGPVGLHATASLYDVFWVANEGKPRLFSFESTDHVAERDPRSPRAVVWRSDERLVARPIEIERDTRDLLGEEVRDTVRFAAPVSVADLDGDGADEVLLVAGSLTPVAMLQNLRVYQGGDARLFEAGPRGLVESHRSPILGRALIAATPWTAPDGRAVWAAVAWTKLGGGFVAPESRVFLLDPATGDLLGAAAP